MAAGYAAVDWLCFMFVVEGLTLNCLNCEQVHFFSRKEECILKVNCKITRRIWLNMVKIFHSDTDEQTTVNCCTLSGSQTFDSNERCHVFDLFLLASGVSTDCASHACFSATDRETRKNTVCHEYVCYDIIQQDGNVQRVSLVTPLKI